MATMTGTDCGCGSTAAAGAAGVAVRGTIERPRFFPRQLVTPDDLTLGQDYLRNKIRRINRYLHGWGVVCGTRVDASTKPWKVIVRPGYILGPFGDEIVVERDVCFDLRTRCLAVSAGDACDEIVDPLCPDRTIEPRRADTPYYVAPAAAATTPAASTRAGATATRSACWMPARPRTRRRPISRSSPSPPASPTARRARRSRGSCSRRW
jgi:hypothetical protein